MKQFIFGGARSGKSSLAERLAAQMGENIAYVATANPALNDKEMSSRITHHRERRPSHWTTIETAVELAHSLEQLTHYDCVLVDCLTLWMSNCMEQACWDLQRKQLLQCLDSYSTNLILVSNEVGMGIVPLGELNRRFVDASGFLHQAIALRADRVVFTAAGLPLVMKGTALENH